MKIPIYRQHTMCLQSLSLARAAMEVLGPAVSYCKTNTAHVAKITRWLEDCSSYTQTKRISQGAKRDMDKAFIHIGKFIDDAGDNYDQRLEVWTAVLSAANAFIFDARRYCKDVTKGAVCWRYLDQTTYTLVRELGKVSDKAEEIGYAMYLHLQVDFSQFKEGAA